MEEDQCCKTVTEKEDGRSKPAADDDGNSRKLPAPSSRRSSKANWTEEEDDILRDAVQKYEGKAWKKIAGCLHGRTDVQCLHRWQKVLNPDLIKGPWSKEEDGLLIELVEKSGEKKWSEIAEQLPGRMGKQCRERWYNHLKPEINKAAWTDEEERILINAHAEYGNKWSVLAKFLPGRTENSVKNHWNCSLKKKLSNYTSRGFSANHPRLTIPPSQAYNNGVSQHSTEANQTPSTTNLDGGSYGKARASSMPSTSTKAEIASKTSQIPGFNSSQDEDDGCDNKNNHESSSSPYTGLCYQPIQSADLNVFLSTGRFPSTESYIREPRSRWDLKDSCDSYRRTMSILRSAAMSYRNMPSIIRKRAYQLLHKCVSALDDDVPKAVDDDFFLCPNAAGNEVVLVDANGLEKTDFLSSTDAYVILTCQDQEKTSKVAKVEGSAPTWNETFMFAISQNVKELKIKIMDKDTLTADDYVGEVTIPLEPAYEVERVPVTMYNVVKDGMLCGGLNVSLKFIHQQVRSRGFSSEDLGGWKSSAAD